jgi:hypothetical protein
MRTKRTGSWGAGARALLLAWAVAAGAAAAGAEEFECDGCGPPGMTDLQTDSRFALEVRDGETDYVEFHGHECTFQILPPPRYHLDAEWWVLMGSGMVWDCPSSKSSDTIVVEFGKERSSDWESSSGGSAGLSVLGFSIGGALHEAVRSGFRVREVNRLEKTIEASWCHRIAWDAYFKVAKYRGEIDWKVTRRWSWWTKNDETGDTVHRYGQVSVTCASGTAAYGRIVPIDVMLHLTDHPCPDAALCPQFTPTPLGFYPPPMPPPPPPPVITPSDLPTEPAPGTPGPVGEDSGAEGGSPAPGTPGPVDGEPGDEPEAPTGPGPAAEGSDPYGVGDPPAGTCPIPPGFETTLGTTAYAAGGYLWWDDEGFVGEGFVLGPTVLSGPGDAR